MKRLVSETPTRGAQFGTTLRQLPDGKLWIPAPYETVNGKRDAGAAYIADLKTGKMKRLVSASPTQHAVFGKTLLLLPDGKLAISAPRETVNSKRDAGAVY